MSTFIGFIYVTTCLVNNKKYIGKKLYVSTYNGNWRIYLGSSKWLNQDIQKYGRVAFKRKIIVRCKTAKELNAAEIYYQKLWNVKQDQNWYNMHIQTEDFDTTGLTWKFSEKRKKEIWSEERREQKSLEMKARNLNYLPGVCKNRSIRLKTGKQYNPFKDPTVIQEIRLKKMKPILLISPEGIPFVFASTLEIKGTLGIDPAFLKKVKKLKQGKGKDWEWKGYLQPYCSHGIETA